MNEPNRSNPSRWLRSLPRAVVAAFVCCFLAGYIVHLFAFTNILPNADGISRVSDPQQMTISGRWFLHYATAWNGFLQAPAVIGFFSVFFLSLASALTVSLLRVRSALIGGLIGGLMIVFPSVAFTYLYLFTASAYCFGLLLAVLAVWLTARYRFGILPGVLVLACAVGTYQAYLAAAVSLALISVILLALEGESDAKKVILAGLKQLLLLILGLAVYFVVLRIFLKVKDLTLLDYKGIGGLGEDLTLKSVLELIGSAYKEFVKYFFVPRSFALYTTPATVVGNAALALAGLWAFVRLIHRNGLLKRPGVLILVLLLCCLLPLALNLTVLMDEAMPIMRYALVFAYVLALALVDQATGNRQQATGSVGAAIGRPPKGKPSDDENSVGAVIGRPSEEKVSDEKKPCKDGTLPSDPTQAETDEAASTPPRRPLILRILALAAALLLFIVSFQVDNTVYTMSATAHRATESFATRLVERVESTPGYEKGMEVVIIGGFPRSVYYSEIDAFLEIEDYSNLSSTVTPLTKQVYYYLNDWLNVPWPEPKESTLILISASKTFKDMPLYPSDGSILIKDGMVIVKLAKKYTPKKDYEIAYENRR